MMDGDREMRKARSVRRGAAEANGKKGWGHQNSCLLHSHLSIDHSSIKHLPIQPSPSHNYPSIYRSSLQHLPIQQSSSQMYIICTTTLFIHSFTNHVSISFAQSSIDPLMHVYNHPSFICLCMQHPSIHLSIYSTNIQPSI